MTSILSLMNRPRKYKIKYLQEFLVMYMYKLNQVSSYLQIREQGCMISSQSISPVFQTAVCRITLGLFKSLPVIILPGFLLHILCSREK